MSQSLYTAMGGIASAQTQLSVVSNNIANINTVGFKQSSVTFQDIFSTTLTAGNSPTVTTGGKNPVQIGLGVQVGTIAKNMASGTWTSTGKTTDLMIQGNGFFSVRSADGQTYLTKAGNFSFDANGDLVNSQGFKVVGADELYSTSSSLYSVNVPQKVVSVVGANENMYNKDLSTLNDCRLTMGTFTLNVTSPAGVTTPVQITLAPPADTMQEIAAQIQTQVNAAAAAATTAAATATAAAATATAAAAAATAAATEAGNHITGASDSTTAANDAFNTGADMTNALHDIITDAATAATTNANAALTAGIMTQAQRDAIVNAAADATTAADAALAAGAGNMTTAQRDAILAAETIITTTETAVQTAQTNIATAQTAIATAQTAIATAQTALANTFGGVNVLCDATTNGTLKFDINSTQVGSLEFVAGTSNFVGQTQMKLDTATGDYSSKVLDYKVDVTPMNSLSNAISVSNYSIGEDGTIEATYSNGDKLTVELNRNDNSYQFKYTTSAGVEITDANVNVNPNVANPANFVIQLANVVNPEGLVAEGGNLYTTGANSGDIMFTVGGNMGIGAIKSGGLEASNVDISQQFSDMILAQRAVQANSRVFTTASDIMQTLVQLGR